MLKVRTWPSFGLSHNTILTMGFESVPFSHLYVSNDLLYKNTYRYSSDTRFLKGVPRMSNNLLLLKSLNKTRPYISIYRLKVLEFSVSELVPILSAISTHKYLRPTSLFLKVFSSRKLIRFPENKLEGEKNRDCQLMSAQFSTIFHSEKGLDVSLADCDWQLTQRLLHREDCSACSSGHSLVSGGCYSR